MRTEFETTQLGVMIREYRVRNHLSQDRMGARLGVNRNTIHLWETRDVRPSLGALQILADMFGESLPDIMQMAETPCIVPRGSRPRVRREKRSDIAQEER